jgi:hypothetical protein
MQVIHSNFYKLKDSFLTTIIINLIINLIKYLFLTWEIFLIFINSWILFDFLNDSHHLLQSNAYPSHEGSLVLMNQV